MKPCLTSHCQALLAQNSARYGCCFTYNDVAEDEVEDDDVEDGDVKGEEDDNVENNNVEEKVHDDVEGDNVEEDDVGCVKRMRGRAS